MVNLRMKIRNILFYVLTGLTFLSSCRSLKSIDNHLSQSNCNQHNIYDYPKEKLPEVLLVRQLDTLLTNRFSVQSLHVANAIGIVESLRNFIYTQKKFERDPTIENRIRLLEVNQYINQRINMVSLEVSAVASELDCEEERTAQVANYLKNLEDDAETRLTVGVIATGAIGAIVSGILLVRNHDEQTVEYIGLGTGIAEAFLGMAILLNKRKVQFEHERNALRDVWEGRETSSIFPASIWFYLNNYNPSIQDKHSLRYKIIEKWMGFGQIAEAGKKNKRKLLSLYFGAGGKYTSEQLRNRANMYDQLESYINLMKQDLKRLAVEFETITLIAR